MQLKLSKHILINLMLIVLGKEDWGKPVHRYDSGRGGGGLAEKGGVSCREVNGWSSLLPYSLSRFIHYLRCEGKRHFVNSGKILHSLGFIAGSPI